MKHFPSFAQHAVVYWVAVFLCANLFVKNIINVFQWTGAVSRLREYDSKH